MKIAIVTDAWSPQVNGVVTTLTRTGQCLERAAHQVLYCTPQGHRTLPCPTYPEIRLALFAGSSLRRKLDEFRPDAIHVATEGPLGIAATRYCTRRGLSFTTSYHTQFPQYVRKRVPIPESVSYAFLRRHHCAAARTLVATEHMRQDLIQNGFKNVVIWSRGVDTDLFKPGDRDFLKDPRPIFLYAGRVAVEKNLSAFLNLPLAGTKYIVGDGPDLEQLRRRYPDVRFPGYRFGDELAAFVGGADVFVFPSRTDTFGLVMLEAMACGTPVAAFPVTGPVDVVRHGITGYLNEDLKAAAEHALTLSRERCREEALKHTWDRATEQFFDHLVLARSGEDAAALEPFQMPGTTPADASGALIEA